MERRGNHIAPKGRQVSCLLSCLCVSLDLGDHKQISRQIKYFMMQLPMQVLEKKFFFENTRLPMTKHTQDLRSPWLPGLHLRGKVNG